jgi:hypothetical protein
MDCAVRPAPEQVAVDSDLQAIFADNPPCPPPVFASSVTPARRNAPTGAVVASLVLALALWRRRDRRAVRA